MRSCLLGLLLLTLLQAGCTPRGISHEGSAGPIERSTQTPNRIRIGLLHSAAPGHADTRRGIDEQIASAIAQTLESETERLGYARSGPLIQGVLGGDLDVGIGLLWPLGVRLPTGLNGFAYDTGELVRVCSQDGRSDRADKVHRTLLPRELRGLLGISHPPPGLARAGRLELSGMTVNGLLQTVATGESDCALAPADLAGLWARYAPMRIELMPLGVGFSRQAVYTARRPELGQRLAGLFSSQLVSDLSRRTRHTAFGFMDDLPETHYEAFHNEVEKRLPRFEPMFREAAARYALDWRLLAAMSYQESHWEPRARSHTGVRGMMMLTRPTAREVGVRNRLDAGQSIRGGARYLRRLIDELPADVTGQDRLWLALAAYNMGMNGLARAQQVAGAAGLDPTHWSELSGVLRGARDAKWREAGVYVERIRDFEDIIRFRRHTPRSLQAEASPAEPTRSRSGTAADRQT